MLPSHVRMDVSERRDEAAYAAYPPDPVLRPFVHRFIHGWREDEGTNWLRIPPTGGLFFSYVAGAPLRVHFSDRVYDRRPRYFIGGQLRREQPVLESLGRFRLFGAELSPTGFYRLFHSRAATFTDDIADFAGLFPELATDLDARFDAAAPAKEASAKQTSAKQTVGAMQSFLRSLVPQALEVPQIEAIVRDIADARGLVSIGELGRRHGLSTRAMHREFLEVVGIPPKHYAKIVQVNAVVGAMQAGDHEELASLAMNHGYFDQSHFIRDFKRFVGASPTVFLRSNSAFLRTYLGQASH